MIGTQTWMAQNLNYTVDSSWCYNNSADSCAKYGRLYQWASAINIDSAYNSKTWGSSDVNHQGICPDDWHLPSNDEWLTLYDYVDANNSSEGVGTSLKNDLGWNLSSEIATGTNLFGFSALPAGYYNSGLFRDAGENGIFWSTTESSNDHAIYRDFYQNNDLNSANTYKSWGFSVRCLKN